METQVRRDDVVFIGTGKCGNNIVDLIAGLDKYGVLAINSANGDLNNLVNILPEDRIHYYRATGAGSNREKGKEYALTDMPRVFEKLDTTFLNAKYVYIIASTAGGTGSGSAIEMAREIGLRYAEGSERIANNGITELPVRYVKVVAVTPSQDENLSELNYRNNLEFLRELNELQKEKVISGYTILCNSKMERTELNNQFVSDIDDMLSLPSRTDGYGEALDANDLGRMLTEFTDGHGMFHMSEIVVEEDGHTVIKPCPYMANFSKVKGCDHIAVSMSMNVIDLDTDDKNRTKWVDIAKGHYGNSEISNKLGVHMDERNMFYAFGLNFPEQVVEEAKEMIAVAKQKKEEDKKKYGEHILDFGNYDAVEVPKAEKLDANAIKSLSKLSNVVESKVAVKKVDPLAARKAKLEALKNRNKK